MLIEFNTKLVGEFGEVYKYGDELLGVYLPSRAKVKQVAALAGSRKIQNGDEESVFSVPNSHYSQIRKIMGIPKLAVFRRD